VRQSFVQDDWHFLGPVGHHPERGKKTKPVLQQARKKLNFSKARLSGRTSDSELRRSSRINRKRCVKVNDFVEVYLYDHADQQSSCLAVEAFEMPQYDPDSVCEFGLDFKETDQLAEVCEIKEDILNIEEESTDEKVEIEQKEVQQPVIELCGVDCSGGDD
jgi:hypothetical protein